MQVESSRDFRSAVSQIVCFSLLLQTTGAAAALPLPSSKTILTAGEVSASPPVESAANKPSSGLSQLVEPVWRSLSERAAVAQQWWRGATADTRSHASEEPQRIAQLGGGRGRCPRG